MSIHVNNLPVAKWQTQYFSANLGAYTQMKWIKLNLSLLKVNIQRTSTDVDLWLNIFNKPTYKQQVDQTFNQKLLNSNTNNKLNKKSP